MNRIKRLGLMTVVALWAFVPRWTSAQELASPVIGTIEVVTQEVFNESGGDFQGLYRVANGIHVRTRERVILRELLFETGEPVDQELIEQTERNLRTLPFLRDARVETYAVDDDLDGDVDRVDVRITTWDGWSLAPRFDISRLHDRTLWELGLSEKNLFGWGKAMRGSHRVTLDRSIDQFVFEDYQVFGSNVAMEASLADMSDGSEQFLKFDRGYLSLVDPWTVAMGAGRFNRTDPLFNNGVEEGRLQHVGRWGDVEVGRAIRQQGNRVIRVHGAYRIRDEQVGIQSRDFAIAEFGVRALSHRFVRLNHVNQFDRTEDFNLGFQVHGTLGLSSPVLGGQEDRAMMVAFGHDQGFRFRDDHFLLMGFRFSGRHEKAAWRNSLADASLRYLRKHSLKRALVGKVHYRYGHSLDPEVQILLGAETGLRGYPIRQFEGNRSFLLSLEERWFVVDDLGQLLSLGFAGFVDSGFVWSELTPVDPADLKTAVGVSVLLGSTRLSRRPGIRIDIGYGLNAVEGASRLVFAAGSDLQF